MTTLGELAVLYADYSLSLVWNAQAMGCCVRDRKKQKKTKVSKKGEMMEHKKKCGRQKVLKPWKTL